MALHPEFPLSPYETLDPDHRWFPAAEELRSTADEKLLPRWWRTFAWRSKLGVTPVIRKAPVSVG